MPDYCVKNETVTVGATACLIKSVLGLRHYSDPLGEAEFAGISPANWPIVGHQRTTARILVWAMPMGKRILEIGYPFKGSCLMFTQALALEQS